MTSFLKFLTVALGAVTLVNAGPTAEVKAVPTVEDYPEVIPGPGLPSLASLNLTSADLYKRVPAARTGYYTHSQEDLLTGINAVEMNRLKARFVGQCGMPGPPCNVFDAMACFNFLQALGTTPCTVNGGVDSTSRFCQSNGCSWYGVHVISGDPTASSFW